jgi:hypothetical protein
MSERTRHYVTDPVTFWLLSVWRNNSSDAGQVWLLGLNVSDRHRAALGALWTLTGIMAWARRVMDRCVQLGADYARMEPLGDNGQI